MGPHAHTSLHAAVALGLAVPSALPFPGAPVLQSSLVLITTIHPPCARCRHMHVRQPPFTHLHPLLSLTLTRVPEIHCTSSCHAHPIFSSFNTCILRCIGTNSCKHQLSSSDTKTVWQQPATNPGLHAFTGGLALQKGRHCTRQKGTQVAQIKPCQLGGSSWAAAHPSSTPSSR